MGLTQGVAWLPLKRAPSFPISQGMASIALSIVRCIDYLAYGTIFTRVMFLPKIKVMFFFLPEKPQMSAGGWRVIE
jgi:hypothetical protein